MRIVKKLTESQELRVYKTKGFTYTDTKPEDIISKSHQIVLHNALSYANHDKTNKQILNT